MAQLEIRNAAKRFGMVTALDGVSLTVADGEFAAILGPSGCGKTTLLRIVAGFVHPDSGQVLVDGRDMTNIAPERRNMGLVFQSYALFPHLSVAENIAYGLRARGMPRAEIRQKVDDALRLVRLEGLGGRKPAEISGGQQQRVALARALVIEPDILLLDEPLSALDRAIRIQMQAELRRIQAEVGITTIFVTHDQEEAMTLANRVVVLRNGVIQQQGTPEDLYLQPANPFVSTFLGAANTVRGTLEVADGAWQVRHGEIAIPVAPRAGFRSGELVDVVVRPEWIDISVPTDGGAIEAEVVEVHFGGSTNEITVRHGDLELRSLRLSSVTQWHTGQRVGVRIDRTDLPLYPAATGDGNA
ncbi:MAG TPA: ABC transporter ATP-binding protein [Chloroflexota bacterium]|nr:ABC transporter ATP-binding protein [Chloroflexota bacterium]